MTQSGTRTSTNQNPPSADQIREEVQQAVREATTAAREAARAGQTARGQNGEQVRVIGPVFPPGFPGGGYTGQSSRGPVIPSQAVDIAIGFFVMCAVMVIGWPLARAFGKRIERRAAEPAALNPQMAEQLQRIEQAVDAMSVEIERISESQRYLAKLQSAPALPVERR